MNVTINSSFGMNQDDRMITQAAQKSGEKQGAKNKNGTPGGRNQIFAGDTMIALKDPIEFRRRQAQQRAMKVVSDAWANDAKIDESMNERRAHYNEQAKIRDDANQELSGINRQKEELKEQFGIKDDSKEQKDLELLEKRQDYMSHVSTESPTPEEWERLAEIDKEGLTEYQKRALSLNGYAGKCKIDMEEASRQMRGDVGSLRSIRIERLKADPMVEAEKTKEKILASANKEVMGMLVDESLDNIDEKAEEAKEEAEKKAEEKEEQEDKIDDIKEKQALEEAMIERTKEAVDEAKAEQRKNEAPEVEIEDMMNLTGPKELPKEVNDTLEKVKTSMKLLEADLKGIKVDEQV